MVETGNECRHTDYMLSRGKNYYGGLLRESAVPAKFLLVLLQHVACGRRDIPTRWLWYGLGTEHAAYHGTRHRLSAYSKRLVDTSSLGSRLHHSGKRVLARHPCIEFIRSCCLCQCCTHDSSFLLSCHIAQVILSVYVDDIKLAGKTPYINPIWKFSGKTSIWEHQHHSSPCLVGLHSKRMSD